MKISLVVVGVNQIKILQKVPITVEDEVSFTNKYSLITTINHSDTLNRSHYWAFIKDLDSSTWYSCKSVFNVEENYVNNATSYILFYSKV